MTLRTNCHGKIFLNFTYLDQFEGNSQMMVLKDWLIIVDNGQLTAGVDKILVSDSRMIHIMDAAGKDGS